MTPHDIETIQTWSKTVQLPVRITLIPVKDDPISMQLVRFCDQLKKLFPDLEIKRDSDAPFSGPAILIGRNANIVYRALPEGLELPPFLEALGPVGTIDPSLSDIVPQVERLEVPLLLSLYISAHCPHCPAAVRRLLHLASLSSKIRLTVIDGLLFEVQAQTDQIRSVPTLILDDQFRWSSAIDVREILDMAVHRDPIRISALSLRQMLEEGGAAQAAQVMVEQDAVFPALLELLVHPRWSVRLGAMVAVEYLVESAPALAAGLVEPLWERFMQLDSQIQGDVVQVLGQIGTPSARKCLHAVVKGAFDSDVKEAAAEELQSLKE
jgi:glutaredoxin